MKADTFRDLVIWQKSVSFVTEIYRITNSFPKDEIYSLTNQLRRAAISLPSNIAEGFGRRTRPEFSRYLQISIGSLFEIQTQLQIAFNLGYVNSEVFGSLFEASREIERMIKAFIKAISKNKQ